MRVIKIMKYLQKEKIVFHEKSIKTLQWERTNSVMIKEFSNLNNEIR